MCGFLQWSGSARLGFISVRASLSHTLLSGSLKFYFQSCQGQIKWLHEWENAEGFETDGLAVQAQRLARRWIVLPYEWKSHRVWVFISATYG